MGIYVNPNNSPFWQSTNSQIYVDKSMLIEQTNAAINTEQKYICVSRPRRFGKSMTANMLSSYYSRGCNSEELFLKFKIAQSKDFRQHLNKYNVIHINMVDFWDKFKDAKSMTDYLQSKVIYELKEQYKDINLNNSHELQEVLLSLFAQTNDPFVFIIDEWDCVMRDCSDLTQQKSYLEFLRALLKDKAYVALAYMTGILPIKKWGQHSALNMFDEYSMTDAAPFSEYTGFTEEEVKILCDKYNIQFEKMKLWYDGYSVDEVSIYNPNSVVQVFHRKNRFNSYWSKTETYEALKKYIQRNEFDIRDIITDLLDGKEVLIDTATFQNDMDTFTTKDDILTLLVHLGYLTYRLDPVSSAIVEAKNAEMTTSVEFEPLERLVGYVKIPNFEIRQQFVSTLKALQWNSVLNALKKSNDLLDATIAGKNEIVSEMIATTHNEVSSVIQYNDENSLSCTIKMAYYTAQDSYMIFRELPSGKGFADLVFIPKPGNHNPAMIIELKWDHTVKTAIDQIKERKYIEGLNGYVGDVLLVGINYNKDGKEHQCGIDKITKFD